MRMQLLALTLLAFLGGCEPATAPPVATPSTPPAPPPPPPSATAAGSTTSPTPADEAAQIDPGAAGDIAVAAVPPGAQAFLAASADFGKTLAGITDGPSANAAAPQMKAHTARIQAALPAFKLFMATAPKEQVELVLLQQASDQMAMSNERVDYVKLAKEPGNEAFREAFIGFFEVMRDDGTSGTRRNAERMLAKLRE